jgi:hypothetical protein
VRHAKKRSDGEDQRLENGDEHTGTCLIPGLSQSQMSSPCAFIRLVVKCAGG